MLLGLVFRYLRRQRAPLAALLMLQTIQTACAIAIPAVNASMIDSAVAGDRGQLWHSGGLMLVVIGLQIVFLTGVVRLASTVSTTFGHQVRDDLFRTITRLSTREIERMGTATLVNRVTSDISQVEGVVLRTVTLLVAAPLALFGGIFMALRVDSVLARILLVSIPLLLVVIVVPLLWLVPESQRLQDRLDRLNGMLREQIVGVRTVRAFVRENHERARFAVANDALGESTLRSDRLTATVLPAVMLVVNLTMVAAVWIGAPRIDAGQMGVGSLVGMLGYLSLILGALLIAIVVGVQVPLASVCAERIGEVLSMRRDDTPPAMPRPWRAARGIVEVEHVSVRTAGAPEPILADVSLIVPRKSTMAIVGGIGSGKTTLLGLMARLGEPTAGSVRLDGHDLRDLSAAEITRRLALVPQRPLLFSGTIASNLRHGAPDATDEELWAYLRTAQVDDVVRSLPGGLGAPVAQGGRNFSGGQRQRLTIARALARRPDVLLLDDPFSALDAITEAQLRDALRRTLPEVTVVMVVQRASSIRSADLIVVLERGRLAGVGSHDELQRSCPVYAEILAAQSEAQVR